MRALESGTKAKDHDGVPKSTILTLIWAFATVWWSIFTPPERTFAARIVLLQPLWSIRILKRDGTWVSDLFLTLFVHACYSLWTGAWSLPSTEYLEAIDLGHHGTRIYLEIASMLSICGIFAGMIVHRGSQLADTRSHDRDDRRIEEELLPPLLIPSKTTHTRVFPQKHSFAYSYLLVGISVGISGRVSKALSVDGSPPAWFDVRAEDYLNRGDSHLSLAEKLKAYLHTEGVTDRDYAFAYLVTAPRFLGYSFNPVSFWYLYDSDTRLKYMILEVNNTFDERRLYLLKSDRTQNPDPSLDLAEGPDLPTTVRSTLFTDTWQKDFHVSPFNSRKGSYSLRATDPLHSLQETGHFRIDNTIVLRSSKDHPKLIARIFSTTEPLHAASITLPKLLRFTARWWWVGLLTFPRIAYQAKNLFFSKALHVWFRPEVTPTSLGRAYTSQERDLELFFRAFLTKAVTTAQKPLRLIYHPPHADAANSEIAISSQAFTYEETHSRTLTLRVLSPAFYSRFAHYSHVQEAFDREALATDEKNRTLVISPPTLLPLLLHAIAQLPTSSPQTAPLETIRWRLLTSLRCPPPPVAYPPPGSPTPIPTRITDIRPSPPSHLDTFTRRFCTDAPTYRKICTQLFLAQRFFFGVPALVSLLDLLLRAGVLLLAIKLASRSDVFDVLRPKVHGAGDWAEAGGLLLAANAVHSWSLLKG